MSDAVLACVGVGSNLNSPESHIKQAIGEISSLSATSLESASSVYLSAPLAGLPQPDYCNAVVQISTGLRSEELLRQLHGIEAAHGRRRSEKWAARTLDLDLLLYDRACSSSPALTLPHPELLQRDFVLQPLAEIAPDLMLPDGCSAAEAAAAFARLETVD